MDLTEQHKKLVDEDTSVEYQYKKPTMYSIDLLGITDKINAIKKFFFPDKVIIISKSEEKMLEVDEQIRNHNKNIEV